MIMCSKKKKLNKSTLEDAIAVMVDAFIEKSANQSSGREPKT